MKLKVTQEPTPSPDETIDAILEEAQRWEVPRNGVPAALVRGLLDRLCRARRRELEERSRADERPA